MVRAGFGVALSGLLLAGCTNTVSCTLIGAESGVRVSGGAAGASVRICADADCASTTFVGGFGFVPLPSLHPGRTAELVATYRSAGSPVVSRITVVPEKHQPNGPRCDPIVAAASLVFDRTGRASGSVRY